jgi:hypothetical protein
MKVISLGWGVQSWTLAAMVALKELEPIDFAIHSDTTWEREVTYQFREQWEPWLIERNVKVITVNDAKAARQLISPHNKQTHAPLYTLSENGNGMGQLRRSCTHRWKIAPMHRYISSELERLGIAKTKGVVEQWLGITMDEWQRAKDSDVKYIKHRFPFLEMNMTRADCLAWLDDHRLPSPGKSSCVFCPYHNRHAWERMKQEHGNDWEQAVEVDRVVRDKRPPYPLFVHSARVPLSEAVTIPEDFGAHQVTMFELLESEDKDAECDSGYCFL